MSDHLVPMLPDHGAPQAIALLLLTLLALLMAALANRWRSRLRPTGVLPTLARGGEFAGRLLAVFPERLRPEQDVREGEVAALC